ncbi:Por secretion system C-terminal sorting domain-containing protein [Mesonia phycicola]|uniref:Por secretion system C-terminal sorting domain-containing protein n=1 Tax=Mesonia phycicola TaxID=579105 RepID=A0A1M6GKD2_9FLAO|nr:T9SS type A sorting domain-containing protein [Mesonia phycicola]SHJ10383.1 Por secretion system C-terminal sorting domain-containing protein [Mesonia phycicola]
MKTKLFFIALLSIFFNVNAQTAVNLSMGAAYADEVFYDFSTNQSNSYTASSWEIAFLRNNTYSFAIRINDGINIEVFQASNTATDYATIDVANEANWTPLYNDTTTWDYGAFDQGSATYGWGEYNATTHHVEGTATFVLKYSDGTYRKLFIEDYFGGYTFKYATWDATTSTWGADTSATVSNSSNPDNIFNYYSLSTSSEVIAEPVSTDWDIKFTKFTVDYPYNGTTIKYNVTGVLHHPDVTVAENIETGAGDPNTQNYSSDISTIGYDWKGYNGQGYAVETDLYYYVKDINNNVYRLHFTSFDGSSTGNLSFNSEDVTSLLGVTSLDNGDLFGFYPNPAQDQIEIIYENTNSNDVNISIYSITGQKVLEKKLNTSGFYNQKLDVSNLSKGNYLIHFQSGNQITTKKLILN